ncbi:MAG TPA: bifunctional phosphoribosyl-AMP cyclohydrolase/phosphoribosyl-ATP pyrophosphatase [Lachnospiraceae bacterium]|nr:bifunctional phosphoribosyl-AMP cyclohydrolase/phosphoribosyl-ATP pyrophosphatase [Lachnospiraceae bacterium]
MKGKNFNTDKKLLIPCVYLKDGRLVSGFKDDTVISDEPADFAADLVRRGADRLIIFDLSGGDREHEENLTVIREITANIDIPVIGAGNINRSEDVKKLKYAGCSSVALNMAKESNIELTEEVSKRFGRESITACADIEEQILDNAELIRGFVGDVILLNDVITDAYKDLRVFCVLNGADHEKAKAILSNECVAGISGDYVNHYPASLHELKRKFEDEGFGMNIWRHKFAFEEFKTGSDGLVPVVVQDEETDKVLMVAYMNREAYERTEETGIMTYYSRSRGKLWVKGETSGHYQYVRELYGDCDMDTILARVKQIGNACHTGSYSCFFNEIVDRDRKTKNPARVFEEVLSVILDRKENPKEGSYTNYLFEKGLDKILKKVGEEATEIVIAAKNPDKEEVKYEISDLLYHIMVLMAECGLDWNDITGELSKR